MGLCSSVNLIFFDVFSIVIIDGFSISNSSVSVLLSKKYLTFNIDMLFKLSDVGISYGKLKYTVLFPPIIIYFIFISR